MPENKNDINLDGWDLHRAAKENRIDIASELIARGDDVNARDKYDYTPLHLAAENNCTEAVRLLVEHGADLDQRARLLIKHKSDRAHFRFF